MPAGLRNGKPSPAGGVEDRRPCLHPPGPLDEVSDQGIVEVSRRQVPAGTRGQRGQGPHFNGPLVILAAHNRLSVPVLRGTLITAAERPQFSLRIAGTGPVAAAYRHRTAGDPVERRVGVLGTL